MLAINHYDDSARYSCYKVVVQNIPGGEQRSLLNMLKDGVTVKRRGAVFASLLWSVIPAGLLAIDGDFGTSGLSWYYLLQIYYCC